MDTERIIRSYRTIAVIGLSSDPDGPGYMDAFYLNTVGFRMVPVIQGADELFGEKTWPTLRDIPFPVEIVLVANPIDDLKEIADTADEIGAKVLWLQEGIVSEEVEKLCQKAGMDLVIDRNILREYRRRLSAVMSGSPG